MKAADTVVRVAVFLLCLVSLFGMSVAVMFSTGELDMQGVTWHYAGQLSKVLLAAAAICFVAICAINPLFPSRFISERNPYRQWIGTVVVWVAMIVYAVLISSTLL